MKVLVTGATGYIGSHTIVELLNSGYEVIGIDNFSNSKAVVVDKIKKITGKKFLFYEGDLKDKELLEKIFSNDDITIVIHFAGFKAVGESVLKPLKYYENNLLSTVSLCETMEKHHVYNLIFSSTAAIYGNPSKLPVTEDSPLLPVNPYSRTKLMIEQILKDLTIANPNWHIVCLRYFNPVGAHESGLIGEDPNGIPNNLMPYIVKVATKKLDILNVFGNDYKTSDGTGVRDYIHVVDLALGHIKAIEYTITNPGIEYFNLGVGKGYSVLEVVHAFEKANNVDVSYQISGRRPGDIDACYADTKKAEEKLHWRATKGLEEMCHDSYLFAQKSKID